MFRGAQIKRAPGILLREHGLPILKVCTLTDQDFGSASAFRQDAAPETALYEIAELLEENHVKHVPIVSKGGDLVGLVSRANIIQAIASVRPKLGIAFSDTIISERFPGELKQQPWVHIHKLNVTVANGVVDLWGLVQSDTERQSIAVAAEAIPGVTAVNDHVKLEPGNRLLAKECASGR
jgi:hypothetical protein